jgi:acyl carrier protein
MERQELIDKLTEFLRKATANPDLAVDPEAKLVDLGLNSSGRLELFSMIEDEWDLMLDEDDTDEVANFNDVVALVEKELVD